MYLESGIIIGIIVIAYGICKYFKLYTELSLFISAVTGGIAFIFMHNPEDGFTALPRHIAEGAITYMDINLTFIAATLFMNIVKESGGIAFAVRGILNKFHNNRAVLLILLSILLLIPGALTGAGSVTVLVTGSMVAVVLYYMGIPKIKVAAIIFIIAGLSAAAPPVSLWAMIAAAGVNMPYIGFFWPLLLPCLVAALFTIFFLGWKGTKVDLEKALSEIPKPHDKMNWLKVLIPFVIFFGLMVAGRKWPYDLPIMGLPFMFLAAAAAAFFLSPIKLNFFKIASDTIDQLLPLIGTLTSVGVLVQILTWTGGRGEISILVVSLPVILVIATLFITLPVTEAILMYGAAAVIGVPLVLLFNKLNYNAIVALAGMSVIWPLGDALPPTAIIGRLTVGVVGVDNEPYSKFLKQCIVPALVIIIIGTLMVAFSKELGFLTGL